MKESCESMSERWICFRYSVSAVRHARKDTRLTAQRVSFSSSADVFSAIFSREFISSVLEDILQSNPDAFCHNTGGGGMSNAPVSARDVYQAFACRVWIQGRGVTVGQGAKDAFKNALKWIGERCTERLNGLRKTLLVHSKVTSPAEAIRKHFSTDNCNACFIPWGGALRGRKDVSIHWPWVKSFVWCRRSLLDGYLALPSCCFPLH